MAKSSKQPGLLFIFITLLIDVIGVGIIIPVLPDLIKGLAHTDDSGAALWGGWLIGVYALMQFVFSPMVGQLSDAYGRRPIILLSMVGLAIDYLIVAFAPNIYILFIGRIISGIFGASFTAAQAYIADISTPEKRAQNFGLMGAAFGLGFIIGPVIGGLLGQGDPKLPFIAAAILAFLNFLYGAFILPESHKKENRRPFQWKNANPFTSLTRLGKFKGLTTLIVAFFFLYMAGMSLNSVWSFYTKFKFEWTAADIGYSLGVVGALVALVQGLIIRYTNKIWGAKKSIVIGLLFATAGMFLFAFAWQGWMMYIILIPYCLSGLGTPSMQSVMSNQVPPSQQGELQGAVASLISIVAFLGPLIMTQTFAYFSSNDAVVFFPGAPFLLGGIFSILSLLIALRALKRIQ